MGRKAEAAFSETSLERAARIELATSAWKAASSAAQTPDSLEFSGFRTPHADDGGHVRCASWPSRKGGGANQAPSPLVGNDIGPEQRAESITDLALEVHDALRQSVEFPCPGFDLEVVA